eukprot:11862130-Ditylum_brightwellii.AAC.1
MVCVLKERSKERKHCVLENFERVCKLTCLRHHWYILEVFVDAFNQLFNLSPQIRTDELDFIITRHPKYNSISNQENNISVYSQWRQMKSLVAKGAARWKYRFYWCGNKGESPQ